MHKYFASLKGFTPLHAPTLRQSGMTWDTLSETHANLGWVLGGGGMQRSGDQGRGNPGVESCKSIFFGVERGGGGVEIG